MYGRRPRHDHSLLNAIAMPVFVLERNRSGNFVYAAWNDAAVAASGIPRDQVIGYDARKVYGGRAGHEAYKRHMQVATTGARLRYDLMLPMDRGLRKLRTTLTPTRNRSGMVDRLVGISQDLSLEGELQFQRQQADADAAIMVRDIEAFIATGAHDSRLPMRNVTFIANMLRDGFEDLGDGKLELIRQLEHVALTASSLLNDVLLFAQGNLIEGKPQLIDARQLCADLFVGLDATGKHDLNGPECWLMAEQAPLQAILGHLVDNAIRHSGRDSTRVDVSVTAGPGDMLTISVTDDGAGFAPGQDPLQDIGANRVTDGMGLRPGGLFVARRLVLARGGTMQAARRPDGTGAVISFTIPGTMSTRA